MPAAPAVAVVHLLFSTPFFRLDQHFPFTRQQAEEVREDFEDMLDTEFVMDGLAYVVNDIVVCPFDTVLRQSFFSNGMSGYDGDECDVVLAVTDAATESLSSFIGITDYIAAKGVSYNYPS